MSSIVVGTAITSGPVVSSLRPYNRVELGHQGGREMVAIITVRPLSGGKHSVIFITDDATTFRMEYDAQSGTGTVLQ